MPSTKPASHSKMESRQTRRVALVCDWLTTPGGAEKVLLELHRLYPEAPIYTSQYSRKGIDWLDDAMVKTGWLQIIPAGLRKFLGPLRQIYFSHLDLSDYDLVISVTGAEAKAIRTRSKNSVNKLRKRGRGVSLPHQNPRRLPGKHPTISPLYHTFDEKSIAFNKATVACVAQERKPASPLSASLSSPSATAKKVEKFYTKTEVARGTAVLSGHSGAQHICYCHVPTQYYWQMYDKYLENPGFGVLNPLVKFCFKLLVKPLRRADYRAAQRPDQFVTISSYAKEQIAKYYQREAVIVAPPVEIEKFARASYSSADLTNAGTSEATSANANSSSTIDLTSWQEDYYIIACRQANWKRVDLAIAACKMLQKPLLVVGDGPEHPALEKLAGGSPWIKFLPWASSSELAGYLQKAKGYIFPSLEPFGIAAVEALAAGCPVIALSQGGSQDFVQPGQNGVLFANQTAESLVNAIKEFEQLQFDRAKVAQTAAKFSASEFDRKIRAVAKPATGESGHELGNKPVAAESRNKLDNKSSHKPYHESSKSQSQAKKGSKS